MLSSLFQPCTLLEGEGRRGGRNGDVGGSGKREGDEGMKYILLG